MVNGGSSKAKAKSVMSNTENRQKARDKKENKTLTDGTRKLMNKGQTVSKVVDEQILRLRIQLYGQAGRSGYLFLWFSAVADIPDPLPIGMILVIAVLNWFPDYELVIRQRCDQKE